MASAETTEERRELTPSLLRDREAAIVGSLLAISFLISGGICGLLVFQATPRWTVALAVLLLCALGCRFLVPVLGRRGLPVAPLLVIGVLNLFVLAPELALRAVDFRYASGSRFGYPDPAEFTRFVPDAELFWKRSPSARGVNSMGFRGAEPAVPKPANVFRILYLGDSCTEQGYPEIVQDLLNVAHLGERRRFESVPLAVSGYSSHQGRVLADRYGDAMDPDIVVIYFGWNDHWRAYGSVDSDKVVRVPNSSAALMVGRLYNGSRLLQATRRLVEGLVARPDQHPLETERVPAPEYERNLRTMLDVFSARGTPVVFITAPSSHETLGVPDHLVDIGQVPDKEFAVRIHSEYTDIVRAVSGDPGGILLDLEAELSELSDTALAEVFLEDGIHFTRFGLGLIAERVAAVVLEAVGSPAPADIGG